MTITPYNVLRPNYAGAPKCSVLLSPPVLTGFGWGAFACFYDQKNAAMIFMPLVPVPDTVELYPGRTAHHVTTKSLPLTDAAIAKKPLADREYADAKNALCSDFACVDCFPTLDEFNAKCEMLDEMDDAGELVI